MEEAVFHENKNCIDNLLVECKVCNMWLQGHSMWEDHKKGKKHQDQKKGKPAKQAPKVIVPTGTVIIIEQTAIYNDAVQRYTLTLYKRALLRSRLWSAAFSKKTSVRKFEHMLFAICWSSSLPSRNWKWLSLPASLPACLCVYFRISAVTFHRKLIFSGNI